MIVYIVSFQGTAERVFRTFRDAIKYAGDDGRYSVLAFHVD